MGGGVLIAEVQQSSDATFRIFDWNRLDEKMASRDRCILPNLLRPLIFPKGPFFRSCRKAEPKLPWEWRQSNWSNVLFFSIEPFRLAGPLALPYQGKLSISMVTEGEALLLGKETDRLFRRGDTVLVPASSPPVVWEPTEPANFASLLAITLPDMSHGLD